MQLQPLVDHGAQEHRLLALQAASQRDAPGAGTSLSFFTWGARWAGGQVGGGPGGQGSIPDCQAED